MTVAEYFELRYGVKCGLLHSTGLQAHESSEPWSCLIALCSAQTCGRRHTLASAPPVVATVITLAVRHCNPGFDIIPSTCCGCAARSILVMHSSFWACCVNTMTGRTMRMTLDCK